MHEQFSRQKLELPIGQNGPIERVFLTPAGYVTVGFASILTGLSQSAIRGKIREGKWIEGQEFARAPDGGIFISIKGFERWVCAGSK